ncbi:MAG: SRPBCC domain-containing protein [Alphaproteobacteria bacterium]|nr:SRPBCC domain-containing protein [Alphaproteobacteria bacterium]
MTVHSRAIERFARDDIARAHITVDLAPTVAYEKFRHDIARWWPREYTYAGESLEDLFLEGRKGGVFWERGPEGFRCDLARVLRWVPPEKIILRWHISPSHRPEPNPERASEVEIRFVSDGGTGTRVELEHRAFSRHGTGAGEYCARMGSDTGWPFILKQFAEHCGCAETVAPRILRPVA